MVVSTKDTLQAHRFLRRRVHAALVDGDADSAERPLSRLGTGAYAGVFVTAALLAVAAIVGILRPGASTAWQEPGAFIVENETGSRYVYLDGTLHPVVNYSSARLLLGDRLHVVSVPAGLLAPVSHGPPVGIMSAPDSLPDAAHMAGSTWSVCAVGDRAGAQPMRTAILPGSTVDGTAIPTGEGYLLRSSDGRAYLIAQGHAFPIDDRWLAAIGYRDAVAIPVTQDFIAALPRGEPIGPATVPGLGEQGPPLPGSADPVAVGTVFADGFDAHYLLTRAGLVTLTPLQADLLMADPRLSSAYSGHVPAAIPISQAQVTGASPTPLSAPGDGPQPPTIAPAPATLSADQEVCVRYPADGVPDIVVAKSNPETLISPGTVQLATGSGALLAVRCDTGATAAGEGSTIPRGAIGAGDPVTDGATTGSGSRSGSTAPDGAADQSVGGGIGAGDPRTASATAAGSTAAGSTAAGSTAAGSTAGTATVPDAAGDQPVGCASTAVDTDVRRVGRGGSDDPGSRAPTTGAALADSASSAGGDQGALICLVSEAGVRYPLAGPRALQQLGFSGVSVAQLPAAVVRLLPVGPVLDPAVAAATP